MLTQLIGLSYDEAAIVCGVPVGTMPFTRGLRPRRAHGRPCAGRSGRRMRRPRLRTFTVRVIEADSRLELRWRSGADVLVPDYDGHSYLRVGPKGVKENQQSNAVYLNRSRLGSATIPDGLKPDGPPVWKRISTDPVARWHDHRIHWMSSSLPPQVAGKTGRRQLIQDWEVPVIQGSTGFTVTGTLFWVPGAIPALAVLVGIAFGIRGSTGAGFGRLFSVGYVSIAAWLLAADAVVLRLRRHDDARYLLTFAAGLMFVVGGLAEFTVLSGTRVPFAFSVGLARWCIAVTLGLGFGLAVAGVLLTRPAPTVTPTVNPAVGM